jgi:hypothetical protein
MYKISGPIASYALKVGDKNIVLFGDWHGSNDKQCHSCTKNCFYVVKLLNNLQPKSDLFIESFIHSHLMEGVQPTNVISNVIKSNFDKMHNHQGKPLHNVRVHYTDIRSLLTFKPFIDTLNSSLNYIHYNADKETVINMLTVISWCNTVQKLKTFLDVMLKSDNYIMNASNMIPHQYVKHFTNKYDLMKHNRMFITRLRKQLLKLKPQYQQTVLAFHNDQCIKLIKKHKSYDKAMQHFIQTNTLSASDVNVVALTLLKWGSHLKDLYTIARMLYYLDTSKNIVSYDGVWHSRVYASFFKQFMSARIIYKEAHIKENKLFGGITVTNDKEFRCVKLPKKVVESVFISDKSLK